GDPDTKPATRSWRDYRGRDYRDRDGSDRDPGNRSDGRDRRFPDDGGGGDGRHGGGGGGDGRFRDAGNGGDEGAFARGPDRLRYGRLAPNGFLVGRVRQCADRRRRARLYAEDLVDQVNLVRFCHVLHCPPIA